MLHTFVLPICLKLITVPVFLHFITSLSHLTGAQMIPISWCEMQCPRTHSKEFRKVARVQPEYLQAWEAWKVFFPQGTHSFPSLLHYCHRASRLCFRCFMRDWTTRVSSAASWFHVFLKCLSNFPSAHLSPFDCATLKTLMQHQTKLQNCQDVINNVALVEIWKHLPAMQGFLSFL